MEAVVRFGGVSKRYVLRHERDRSFQEAVLGLFRRGRGKGLEEFWALQDVSFEVFPGETVGLIGSNGAGKSTVLKLISRIIEPTSGTVEVNGRLGALLELGAGFHPDLTGRENVYLNASILGLTRDQVRRGLDEIVAFAELERFIDVPVKHYSSGMYVRLGFSVAVHAGPEVLLVDEVLAVGDAAFQRKCLDRIDDLRRRGVTILFVSHNTEIVRNVCRRVLWLDEGRLVSDGPSEAVVARYLDHAWTSAQALAPGTGSDRRWGSGEVRIVKVRFLDRSGQEKRVFRVGEPLTVEIGYRTERRVEHPVFGLAIHRSDGVHVTGPNTRFAGLDIPFVEGEGSVLYHVGGLSLLGGSYFVSVSAVDWDLVTTYDYQHGLYGFEIRRAEHGEQYGLVSLMGDWELVC